MGQKGLNQNKEKKREKKTYQKERLMSIQEKLSRCKRLNNVDIRTPTDLIREPITE